MRERDEQVVDLSSRVRSLEQFGGALRRPPRPDAEAIPINDAPVARIPVPRRSRVFLRGGDGPGGFADVTLTAPRPPSPRGV